MASLPTHTIYHYVMYLSACIIIYGMAVFSVAEELFLRSWKAYECQFGDVHLMVVKSLQNLALFYSQTGRYKYHITYIIQCMYICIECISCKGILCMFACEV